MLVYGGVTTVRMSHVCECTGWKNSKPQSQISLFWNSRFCGGLRNGSSFQCCKVVRALEEMARENLFFASWFRIPYHPWDWYIHLHLVDFLVNAGKYTKNMDAMGMCPMFQVSAKGCWALYCGARMAEGCCVGHVLTVQAGTCLWGVFDENPGFELRTSENFASSCTTKFSVVSTSTRFPQGRNVNVFYKQPFVIPCLDDKYVRAFIRNRPLGFFYVIPSVAAQEEDPFFFGENPSLFSAMAAWSRSLLLAILFGIGLLGSRALEMCNSQVM